MADGSRAAHGRERITKAELARAVDNGIRAFQAAVVRLREALRAIAIMPPEQASLVARETLAAIEKP